MMDILIASGNVGKLREIQSILENHSPDIFTLNLPHQLGLELEVLETGSNYAENAALKAQAYARSSGLLSLADDSGLEVDALDGAPGLHSARYHPKPGATDADRRSYLLQELAVRPLPWSAHFHCTVAISQPSGRTWFANGDCFGEIIPLERGHNGFGYDPIFLIPELGKTMAELSMAEKNQRSHRARAVLAALPLLLELAKQANS
jgi:XTP/dITP diphosphohydrolase